MSEAARATVRLCARGVPPVAATVLTAFLAPFGAPVAAGLAAIVGACAWIKVWQRGSAPLVQPSRFIGS